MNQTESTVRVFISYTHDSDEHKEIVAQLCAQLIHDGIECVYDEQEQAPSEGWPAWCERQIREAKFVLVVCTETYLKRYEQKEEPGKGLGGTWESHIIRLEFYDSGSKSSKFIPVGFTNDYGEYIPGVLKGASHYRLGPGNEQEYLKLYGHLTSQPNVVMPKQGGIRKIDPRTPGLLFPDSDPFANEKKKQSQIVLPGKGSDSLINQGPIRFSFGDYKTIIESLHQALTGIDPTSESQFDFDDIDIEHKNKLNGVSEDYYITVLRQDEIHVQQIRNFLGHPGNQEISDLYSEIVDELRRKIAAIRGQYGSFEELLLHLADGIINSDPNRFRRKRSTLQLLLSFMYLNCDIGRKE